MKTTFTSNRTLSSFSHVHVHVRNSFESTIKRPSRAGSTLQCDRRGPVAIKNKKPADFGFKRLGNYSLLHWLRNLDELFLLEPVTLSEPWFAMSGHVASMIKILETEGVFSPEALHRLGQRSMHRGILPFRVKSQLSWQLILCQLPDLDICRRTPLVQLFSAPWFQLAILAGEDPTSIVQEPKVPFKWSRVHSLFKNDQIRWLRSFRLFCRGVTS